MMYKYSDVQHLDLEDVGRLRGPRVGYRTQALAIGLGVTPKNFCFWKAAI